MEQNPHSIALTLFIAEIVKTKPSYIVMEDLNVKGMMKNRHLSKAVAAQKFYEFRCKLKFKCAGNRIELELQTVFIHHPNTTIVTTDSKKLKAFGSHLSMCLCL